MLNAAIRDLTAANKEVIEYLSEDLVYGAKKLEEDADYMEEPDSIMVELKSAMLALKVVETPTSQVGQSSSLQLQNIQVTAITDQTANAWQYDVPSQVPSFTGKDPYAYKAFKLAWNYALNRCQDSGTVITRNCNTFTRC